jgi:hypothetical protein
MKTGQWFCIDDEDKPEQRVQLSLNLERHQQLLFTNQAGLKVLQLDYPRFMELLTQRKIKRLRQHVSFSICLEWNALKRCCNRLVTSPADPPTCPWVPGWVFTTARRHCWQEVSRPDLLSLMDQGLVEILETSSSFRKQVSQTLHNRPDRPEEE